MYTIHLPFGLFTFAFLYSCCYEKLETNVNMCKSSSVREPPLDGGKWSMKQLWQHKNSISLPRIFSLRIGYKISNR